MLDRETLRQIGKLIAPAIGSPRSPAVTDEYLVALARAAGAAIKDSRSRAPRWRLSAPRAQCT